MFQNFNSHIWHKRNFKISETWHPILFILNVEIRALSAHLTDGATMTPINTNLATTNGWDGGNSYTCFKKKVFNSETCQNITSWHKATSRICVQVGSSHLTDIQLPGVNCNIALFNFPVVLSMSRILTHLFSENKISKRFSTFH